MKKGLLWLLVLIVLVGGTFYYSRGELLGKDAVMKQAWLSLESLLDRRADLTAQLARKLDEQNPERHFAQMVMLARPSQIAWTPYGKIHANWKLNEVRAVMPAAGEGTADISGQIQAIENQMEVEGQRYNESLREYNNALERFPHKYVAKVLGLSQNWPSYYAREPEMMKQFLPPS